jgi:hypothetical protein
MTTALFTPQDVIAAGCKQQATAERIAGYANARAAGMLPVDAMNKVGRSVLTWPRYERWANTLRASRGLPLLPEGRTHDFTLGAER